MTFKAHKKLEEGGDLNVLYPVNRILMNPHSSSFTATAGGDGIIYFWDF